MRDPLALLLGSVVLVQLVFLGGTILLAILGARALILIPRELAAIRRELAALNYLGASSASSAIAPAPRSFTTPEFTTRTGPLGRL